MNEMSLFMVAIDFSRSISIGSVLLQTWQHTGTLTCSETEMRPRSGLIDSVFVVRGTARVLQLYWIMLWNYKIVHVLYLFMQRVSLCTCRSETELQLWSLQRHTELGGTVPRTSAGLKAPKQVSGSRHRSLRQQSHFPLLTINAAVLNAPLKIRCLLCFHLQPWNLVHPNEGFAPQIHSALHDDSIVESCITETGITDESTFAEGHSAYSLKENSLIESFFLLLYLSYLEAAAPAAAKLKLWINKLEQFSHNKPAACWKSLSSRLLFEEQAIKQKLILQKNWTQPLPRQSQQVSWMNTAIRLFEDFKRR